MSKENGKGQKGKPAKYGHIGFRPMADLELRLERIKEAAEKRGEKKTISGLINECAFAHLPKLEAKYTAA